jgi:hypothetical protein
MIFFLAFKVLLSLLIFYVMMSQHVLNGGGLKVIMENNEDKYANLDLTKVYDYKDLPDKISGRCDNCGNARFKTRVGDGQYLRKCTTCGLTKNL